LADDVPRVEGTAPPGHELLAHRRGGAYFIAKALKEDYDRLLGQMKALKAELGAGRMTGEEAQRSLRDLQGQLEKLRKEIEQKRVLVSPVKIHVQTETTTFDLGPEQLLVITADNVQVEGWEGSQVKCVLEKTILAPDDKPVDAHLKGLKVIHKLGLVRQLVGRTPAEVDADEQKFLASPDGREMNDDNRRSRKALVQQIAGDYAIFHDFQGKSIDTLEIEGLTHQQGNRQIIVGINSPDGGGTLGSDWQRHAALTVYVPKCRAVALRGCLVGLDVTDLHAALILSRAGSQNRDYDGTFRIRGLDGDLTVDNAPLDLIESVRGNVTLVSTMEMANTGTQHAGGERTAYTPPPRVLTCRNIEGDFSAWFTRGDLKLSEISGRIDVNGRLSPGVYAKDVILTIIRRLGVQGGVGFAYEYGGSTIDQMSIEERMTICNMSIEGGARVGYVNPDEKTYEFLRGRPFAPKQGDAFEHAVAWWRQMASDSNAAYDDRVLFDAGAIEPTVTCRRP
jgi:hypothetical protein